MAQYSKVLYNKVALKYLSIFKKSSTSVEIAKNHNIPILKKLNPLFSHKIVE